MVTSSIFSSGIYNIFLNINSKLFNDMFTASSQYKSYITLKSASCLSKEHYQIKFKICSEYPLSFTFIKLIIGPDL